MFKEFGLIMIIFVLSIFFFRWLFCHNFKLFQRVFICSGVIAIIINVTYNVITVFPTFVYEGVPIGDSRNNLFVYKEDSQFSWEILNTVVRNRKVYLDRQGSLYDVYFTAFAEDVQSVEISDEIRETLYDEGKVMQSCPLDMVELMPYVYPDWEGETIPTLFINVESLYNDEALVCIVDKNDDIYIVAKEYYTSLLQEEKP